MGPDEWSGLPLGREPLALVVEAKESEPASIHAVAGVGDRVWGIRSDRLGDFLRLHREALFVCHDVGPFFWAIHDHLLRVADHAALEVLWDLPRSGRLHDVALLDQLVCAAQRPYRYRAASLSELADRHLGINQGDEGTATDRLAAQDVGPGRDAIGQSLDEIDRRADLVLGIYRVLREAADRIIRRPGIDPVAVGRFGPLALTIQVQGAIATAAAGRNGLRVDEASRSEVIRICNAICASSVEMLWGDIEARNCFKRAGDGPKFTKAGFPEFKEWTLVAWLEMRARSLVCLHAVPFTPPSTSKGRASTDPPDWGIWVRLDPLLRAWSDLMAASRLRHCFTGIDGSVLHPHYQLVPNLRSFGPDLEEVRRLIPRTVFRPRPDHTFLIVNVRDLETRALAAVCEHWAGQYNHSGLAELLRQGDDPRLHAAAHLLYLDPKKFDALEGRDPDLHNHAVKLADALLDLAPKGVAPGLLRNAAKQELGVESIPADLPKTIDPSAIGAAARLYSETKAVTIEDAHRRLVQLIYPELFRYLYDDAFEALAERLGITADECADSFGLDNEFSETSTTALRKLLLGIEPEHATFKYAKWRRDVWRRLRELDQDGQREPLINQEQGSPALYAELLGRDVVTPIGRVHGRLSYPEARSQNYLSLASDAMKMALFAVVAFGYRLVGFANTEFVIELPTNADVEADRVNVERLAGRAAESVLGTIPVPCHGELRARW
jgi:hypothetical protein